MNSEWSLHRAAMFQDLSLPHSLGVSWAFQERMTPQQTDDWDCAIVALATAFCPVVCGRERRKLLMATRGERHERRISWATSWRTRMVVPNHGMASDEC